MSSTRIVKGNESFLGSPIASYGITAMDGLCALSLIYSGLTHLSNPYSFAGKIAEYRLVPPIVMGWIPLILASVMIAVGLALISGTCLVLARPIALTLFATFACAQGYALLSGADFNCGCFGYSTEAVSLRSLCIPVLFAGVTLVAIILSRKCQQAERFLTAT